MIEYIVRAVNFPLIKLKSRPTGLKYRVRMTKDMNFMRPSLIVLIIILFCSATVTCYQFKNEYLFAFEENGFYGYADSTGKIVIAPRFISAWDFSEDLARVGFCGEKGYSIGYIDNTGKLVIETGLKDAEDYSEGLAAVQSRDGKWGFIDKLGKWIIAPRFDNFEVKDYKFAEGLAAVKLGEKWGYIDKNGNFVVPPRFDDADDFSEGLAVVEIGGKSGYIDQTGKFIIEPRFDLAVSFHEGLGRVNVGYVQTDNDDDPKFREGKWHYIDKTGKRVISTRFDFAYDFSEGLAIIDFGDKRGFIDHSGKVVIKIIYEDAKDFSEGLAAVQVGEKWGYINKSGQIMIKPQFDEAFPFKGGIAAVNSGVSYIDKTGNYVWKKEDKHVFEIKPARCPGEKQLNRLIGLLFSDMNSFVGS